MKVADIPQADRIDREAFPTMLPPPDYKHELKNKLAHYIVVCDEDNEDSIIGFSGLWMIVHEAHIVNIAVRQSHRGQGLGELLLMQLIKLAMNSDAGLLTLEVRTSNKTAQNLYKKYGFAIAGVRHGYYLDNREDAVIMTIEDIKSNACLDNFKRLEDEHCHRWGVIPSPFSV